MELSDVVAERFRKERCWRSVNALYGTFVLIVAVGTSRCARGDDLAWTLRRRVMVTAAAQEDPE
jgi:hypothetical protein